jgi:hypothetical protein
MRGTDHQQSRMFSYTSAEQRVSDDHPLRTIRLLVDGVLRQLAPRFDSIYAKSGRPNWIVQHSGRAALQGREAAPPWGKRCLRELVTRRSAGYR